MTERAGVEPTFSEVIAGVVRELPAPVTLAVAKAIEGAETSDNRFGRIRVLETVPLPSQQGRVAELLNFWQEHASSFPAQSVALALRSALAASDLARRQQSSEMVWTGPLQVEGSLRRTDQALLEVIGASRTSLLIVSFAVYRIPAIANAIVLAAQRGVSLQICVETDEPDGQHVAYDTIRALGEDVTRRASVYVWPEENRPIGSNGQTGSLHAKCAVADRRLLYLSSANLTDYAMTVNIELGILIRGGNLPALVADQFNRLIGSGVFRRA